MKSLVFACLALSCAGASPTVDAGPTDQDAGPVALPAGTLVPGTTLVATAQVTVAGRPLQLFFPLGDFDRASARLLVLNDGQDVAALGLAFELEVLWQAGGAPFVVLAVPAVDRLQQYGTAEAGVSIPCLANPGDAPLGTTAADYARLVTTQLVPWAKTAFALPATRAHTGVVGFSLGGLSAVSIAWDNPDTFGFAAALSGSFWWRTNPGTVDERQSSRIMQAIVTRSAPRPDLALWFEAGTNDETADRDGDGIIDAIDDTKDLMLAAQGKVRSQTYVEVPNGIHAYSTWHLIFPEFLTWAAAQ